MESFRKEKPNLSKYKNKEKLEHKVLVVLLQNGVNYYFASYDPKGP